MKGAGNKEPQLYLALVHAPVQDKNGATITSAVTNLDLHDLARASTTYGCRRFFVVTPLTDQRELAQKLMDHWQRGYGATYNPQRKRAFEIVDLQPSIKDVTQAIFSETGQHPQVVATTARLSEGAVSFGFLKERLCDGAAYLLLLGTAWGLESSVLDEADFVLAPIQGHSDYNHLSVRSAASIMLDRLMGKHD